MATPVPIPTFPPPEISDPCNEIIPSYLNNGQHSSVYNVPRPTVLSKLFPCSQQPFFTASLYDDTRKTAPINTTAKSLMKDIPLGAQTQCSNAKGCPAMEKPKTKSWWKLWWDQ
jgi:hypothetical protein